MGKYGAFAYSESAGWLGYSSQHDDPEAAKCEALANCGHGDAVILCCEKDCWLAFALSDSTEGYWWSAQQDGPTAATEVVETLRKKCGANDVRLLVCYSTNDGEEYSLPLRSDEVKPSDQTSSGSNWDTAKKLAEVAGSFVRGIIKG